MKLLKDKFLQTTYKPLEDIFYKINKITEDLNVVFIFGSVSKKSARNLFIKYLKKSPPNLIYITIEALTKDLKENVLKRGVQQELIKLIELEYKVINLSYCVLIFPESPGSFAELGFFSKDIKTKRKIFALKDYEYVDDDSYVNRLIDYVHQDRDISSNVLKFKKTDQDKKKHFQKELVSKKFPSIVSKIEEPFVQTKIFLPKASHLLKKDDIQILSLALIHELILIYPYLTHNELKTIYKHCLSKNFKKISFNKDEMNYVLSLLVVSQYIKRKPIGDSYVFINLNPISFFEFDESIINDYELKRNEISLEIRMGKGINL